jgi:Na+/phosphate symporter
MDNLLLIIVAILLLLSILVTVAIVTGTNKRPPFRLRRTPKKAPRSIREEDIVSRCVEEVNKALRSIVVIYNETIHGLSNGDRKLLKKLNNDVEEIANETKAYKKNLHHTLAQLQSGSVETGLYYVQVVDYLREIAHALSYITKPAFDHIDNHHKGLLKEQVVELKSVNYEVSALFSTINRTINEQAFDEIPEIIRQQQQVIELLNSVRRKQIRRIKNGEATTRNSDLYLGILNETKNLLLQTINLLKAERDFIEKEVEPVSESL